LSAFKSWRALEPSRREKAQASLRRGVGTEGLSADVQDIGGRALGED
jgi:aminopeptidase N